MYCTRKPIKLHCILIIIIVICISYTAFEPSNDLKALYILLTPPPPPPTHTHMYTPIPAHLKGVYKRDTCYNAPRVIKVQQLSLYIARIGIKFFSHLSNLRHLKGSSVFIPHNGHNQCSANGKKDFQIKSAMKATYRGNMLQTPWGHFPCQ